VSEIPTGPNEVKIVANMAWPSFRNVAIDLCKALSPLCQPVVFDLSEVSPGGRVILVETIKKDTFKFIKERLHGSDVVLYGPTEGHSILDEESRAVARDIKVVAVSHFVKNMLEEIGIAVAGVVHHGIDMDLRDVDMDLQESIKNRVSNGSMILTVASNDPRKGLPELLQAYKMIEEEFSDVFLLLHSQPKTQYDPVEKRLRERFCDLSALSSALGIKRIWLTDSHGTFTPHQVNTLYSCCSIYVLPSFSEGFGLPILEAFRFDKPVVAVDAPPFNEIIEDGETGKLFDYEEVKWLNYKNQIRFKMHSYSPERLAEAIISLVSDRGKLEAMSRRIGELKKRWDIRTVYPRLFDFF
jgi:glycosyltransferase involved in cell wall biosynthesis